MTSGLVLLLVVAIAYLAAHVASDWLARRLLLVSGAEYLVLGILLGPQVSGVMSGEVVRGFAPVATLVIGWMGALVGMALYLPDLVKVPGLTYRLALGEAVATLLVVGALEAVALHLTLDLSMRTSIAIALAMGAIATASMRAPVDVGARGLEAGPGLARQRQLEVSVVVDAAIAIAAFGLFFALYHPSLASDVRQPTAAEWMLITVGIGLACGALFHLFVGDEQKADRLVVALAGAVILASGTASFLGLSPVLASLVFGFAVVNTSRNRDEIRAVLLRAERPFYFVLLILAGATWRPSARLWIVPVLVFVLARFVGKVGGARLFTRWNGALPLLGPHWGRGLLGQGALPIALGFDYILRDTSRLPNVVFTAAVVSVLLTDLLSARLVRSVLGEWLDPAPSGEVPVYDPDGTRGPGRRPGPARGDG